MKVPFVDLAVQYEAIKEEVDHAIHGILQNTSFVGGAPVSNFETDFARYAERDFAIGCANGTDALEIALEAIGIGPEDEVLVPAYTWVSTANAVARLGGKPVFVDVHPDLYTIDPDKVEEKITGRTKAIMPVHFYGLPADMPKIMEIARANGLKVVEDCAQSHEATINGKKVGTWGDIGTFSFYPGKNLGAYGDAGAMVTNNEALAHQMRVIASQGQIKKHHHVQVGRNSRLDTMQAAILSVKLPHLQNWIQGRNQAAVWYTEMLADLPLKLPVTPKGYGHVFHLYVIQTEQRDELKSYLAERGIGTQIHYPKPQTQIGIFEVEGDFPVSEAMSGKILSLPMYPELTHEQVSYVVDAIRSYFA